MRHLFAALLCMGMAVPVLADDLVSVSATASVNAVPDVAYISTSVQTNDADPAKALSENNLKMKQVFDMLESRFDIGKKNIATSNFSLQARYQHDPQTHKQVFVGYRVQNTITIKVCELDTVGKVISAVVSTGVNRLNGISFAIENREELEQKARVAAVKKAKAKAVTLVETAGSQVGNLKSISESYSHPYQNNSKYMRMAESTAPGGIPDAPVSAGQQAVSVTVSATFQVISDAEENSQPPRRGN